MREDSIRRVGFGHPIFEIDVPFSKGLARSDEDGRMSVVGFCSYARMDVTVDRVERRRLSHGKWSRDEWGGFRRLVESIRGIR